MREAARHETAQTERGHMTRAAGSRRLAAVRRHLAPAAGAVPLPAGAAVVPELPPWYAEAETVDETLARVDLDADAWRAERLTLAEREQFDRDGYLVVTDALPQCEFERCCAALDELRELRRTQGLPATKSVLDPVYSSSHSLWQEDAVVRMLSAKKVLPKVTDIMGWNIYLYVILRVAPQCSTCLTFRRHVAVTTATSL